MVACMAVMARETWTDERLDDLRGDMNRRFVETKGEIRDMRSDMDKRFDESKQEVCDLRAETKAEFKELRAEMNGRFNAMDARFDSLQKTMVLGVVSMSVSIVGALLAA
jgi:predicted nuclease with TOPRIM domain